MFIFKLNDWSQALVTAFAEMYIADMNYVVKKVKDAPLDVIVSLKLCEFQSRNISIVLI